MISDECIIMNDEWIVVWIGQFSNDNHSNDDNSPLILKYALLERVWWDNWRDPVHCFEDLEINSEDNFLSLFVAGKGN